MSKAEDPYLDAMLQGREAAPTDTVDEAAAETEPEAPTVENPDTSRHPDGTSANQTDEPEEPAEQDAPDPLILGKFKDTDALAKSYTELEKHLGELRNDLSSLKQQQDAQAQVTQQEQQDYAAQRQPGPSFDLTDIEDRLLENPVAIYPTAVEAWRNGNQDLVEIALSAWHQIDEKGARRFEREMLKAELAQEYQTWSQPVTQQLQQQQQAGEVQQVASAGVAAFEATAAKYPDFVGMQNEIFEIAGSAPEIAQALASGDQASAERAYENLRSLIMGRRADQLRVEQDKISVEQAQANEAARKNAVVASASSAKALGGEGGKKKAGDILMDVYTQPDESHLPYWERSDYVAG